jgi:penicillin-binding protein 1A
MKPKSSKGSRLLRQERIRRGWVWIRQVFTRGRPANFPKQSHPRRNWRKQFLIASGLLLVLSASVGIWLFTWLQQAGVLHLDESRLKVIIEYQHTDNSIVFARDGRKIGEFYSDYHLFVPYERIPKRLIQAVLAVEDRHFFSHHGIDIRGIARAFLVSLRSGSFTQGGSTLTQQVVRNFLLTPEKTFERKIKEALLAIQLERHLSKERILEIYLNALFLGQGAYGVGAAAERHFGRPLQELELHELALIAGLFQSPSRYNPHKAPEQAQRRQQQVLRAMRKNGFITVAEYHSAKRRKLDFQAQNALNMEFAPYFIDAIQEQVEKLLTTDVKGKGLRIHTTLDLDLQLNVNEAVRRSRDMFIQAARKLEGLKNPQEQMVETAALVLDHHRGEVLAMLGGRDFNRSQFNRALKAKRAPGSAFKTVVYAQGLLQGMKWSDMLYVAPVVIQDYRPANHAGDYMTETTLYSAFFRSINTPVVEFGHKLGTKKILDLARRMGIKTELKNQAGTLLGGSELTLMDMASVYATIGNYGEHIEPRMILRITDRDGKVLYDVTNNEPKRERILPAPVAYLLIDALQAVFRYGTASAFGEWAALTAGKTGTTNEAKDNWFCGISDKLTTVVWVGTDTNLPFGGSVGANTLALPLWVRIMEKAHRAYPFEPFVVPEGIVKLKVNPSFGYRDERGIEMPFLEGREPERSDSSLSIVRDSGHYRDYLDR